MTPTFDRDQTGRLKAKRNPGYYFPMFRALASTMLILTLLAPAGCSSRSGQPEARDNDHVTSTETFQMQMRRMQSLVHEREATASAVREMRARQMDAISKAAATLEQSSSEFARQLDLEPNETERMNRLFGQLRRVADAAVTAAQRGADLESEIDRIDQVCRVCHQQFRAP